MNEATIVSKSEFPDDITLIALRIVKNVNLPIDDKDELFLDIANAILSERDELKSKFDACLQEMSECFRAVNIAKVIRQSGNDFVLQAERMMKMQAELATVKLAAEANHNLAVANGNRAREEYDLASMVLAASHMPVGDGYEPYLWQCKDYADGWITYTDREEALAYQRDTGCLLRITYRPLAASTADK